VFEKTSSTWWVLVTDGVGGYFFNEITVNGAGAWVDNSSAFTPMPAFQYGVYHPTESTLYYFAAASTYDIKSFPIGGGVATTILSGQYASFPPCIVYGTDDKVYFTVNTLGQYYYAGTIYQVSSSAIDASASVLPTAYSGLIYTDRLYGLTSSNKLYQWHTAINMYLNEAQPLGSIKSTLSNVLQAFNLVGIISAHKKAFVYRRGDDAGAIQTTGNNLTITTANTSQIQKVQNEYQKILWVQVTSGDTVYSYDGTTYNAGILTDSRTMEISNDLIPEAIVQDVCKYFFTFYNTAHDKYSFNVDTAKMEYEVMDGLDVTFATKIAITDTGLITAMTINNDGSLQVEAIF